MASPDKKPLISYLKIQESFEADLLHVLARSATDIRKEIHSLAGKQGIGAKVRRDQLRLVLKAVTARQAELWKVVGSNVKGRQLEAVSQAVQTNFTYESMLIRSRIPRATREALLRSAEAQARRGMESAIAKLTGLSDYELSSNVYKARQLSTGWVRNRVIEVLIKGGSWKDIADAVAGSIKPTTPGGVSYAAKRLGRTEINNAFHAGAVTEGINSPFIVGQKWNLSGSHKVPDECNEYAERTHYDGGEPGIFLPKDVPGKPHPQCFCFLTPETPSFEEFLTNFENGSYDTYINRALRS